MKIKIGNVSNKLCYTFFNPIALRKAKIACNLGFSECNRVNIRRYCEIETSVFQISRVDDT